MPAQRVYKQRHQSVKVRLSIDSVLVYMNLIRIFFIFFIDRHLHHYMGINIQGNNRINTGRIRDHIMDPVAMLECHRYSNMIAMISTGHFTISIEKKNGNTKSESTKTNEKNSHRVCVIYDAGNGAQNV